MDTLTIAAPARRTRRRHSAAFRASVIEACRQPGISMAAVALANGLNANMLRKWVQEADRRELGVPPTSQDAAPLPMKGFVPIALPAPAASNICIELQRAGTTISVRWPAAAATECAAWLRDLLR